MSSAATKVILLDIGNVIINVNFGAFCSAVAISPEAEKTVHQKFCTGSLLEDFNKGAVAVVDFLETVLADPVVRTMTAHELKSAWQRIFSLKEGALEGIGRLKERFTVWIMSDTDPLHFTFILNTFPVMRTLDRYFLSYEHGSLKNSPDAFRHILDTTDSEACELLLIDDKPENCSTSKNAGIESIQFTSWNDTLEKLGFS